MPSSSFLGVIDCTRSTPWTTAEQPSVLRRSKSFALVQSLEVGTIIDAIDEVSGNTVASVASMESKAHFLRPSNSCKGFLDLPPEIREQVYELLVVKPTNTITMLSNHNIFKSEISACQPALCWVNRQIRHEALATFYSNNLFLAEVSDRTDLATAKQWLHAIGDANVACLRRLALCGWTRAPFGHMIMKRWIRVVLDLKDGTFDFEGSAPEVERHPLILRNVDGLKGAYKEMVDARHGKSFDVGSVASLMDGFHGMCVAY